MQLNMTTDYAIRTLIYLSKTEQATVQELSDKLKISKQYITSMMSLTRLSEYIQPIIGVKGGYRLKRKANTICLLDIIKTMEKTIKISPCLEGEEQCLTCNTFDTDVCPIRRAYEKIQNQWEAKLSSITIEDLAREKRGIDVCR